MRKILALLFIFALFVSPIISDDQAASFNEQAALSYIKDLASDAMAGRRSGQPGGVMGEKYIAAKLKKWGLEPAGNKGTYFQDFTIEHRNIGEGVVLEILTEKGKRSFYYGDDWRIQRYSGSGHFTAEIVYAGYGIHAPGKEYDDYAGLDIKGKIVLLSADTPPKWKDKDEAKMENRIKTAQELGALGMVAYRSPGSQSRYIYMPTKKEDYNPNFVLLTIQDSVTNYIFKELKTELRFLSRELPKGESLSFNTGVKAHVSVSAIYDAKRPTRNVIAKITGSDDKLKEEYVIIGGHMDHLGISPYGEVYNGANDNASGTAVTMEIARMMKANNAKPKRTVIFALWAGEEQGLLGSRHYCDSPIFPIEKTVAYLNMDMVAHGNGNVPFNGTYYSPQIWKVIKEKLPKEILDYVKPGRGGPGGSDHNPFLAKGVPGYAIMTQGYHFKYHQVRDDLDLVKPEILKKVGDFVHAAVAILADEPGNLITSLRQETYQLKYQNLINYSLFSLDKTIADHGDAKDPFVDLQLAILDGAKKEEGEALRMELMKDLLGVGAKSKEAKGLRLWSSSRSVSMNSRQGKTTVMTGFKDIESFRDDPRWAKVLAGMGVQFVFAENPVFLFGEKGLSEKGETFLKEVNKSGLLFFYWGINDDQTRFLLEKSTRPFILVRNGLPAKEILDLIKKEKSVLGLVFGTDEDPEAFFKKLDEAKKAIGDGSILLMTERDLWTPEAQAQMLKLITEMIKADYERSDFSNLFSGAFLRVWNAAKGPASTQESGRMRF